MGVLDRLTARWRALRVRQPARPAEPLSHTPRHVGIIMDGNGRWAQRRRLPVVAGHREGTRALKRAIRGAIDLGIEQLTVFSFSTENWSRPPDEVQALMDLAEEMIDHEVPELHENGVRVVFVGRREGIAPGLAQKIAQAEALTAANERMILNVAFNYGGRAEIVDAVKAALADGVSPEELGEETVTDYLYVPDMPEPDLIIRTSGEVRLSNFLLWESAYSELYFTDLLWPDFDEDELTAAVRDFAGRERRFGLRSGPRD